MLILRNSKDSFSTSSTPSMIFAAILFGSFSTPALRIEFGDDGRVFLIVEEQKPTARTSSPFSSPLRLELLPYQMDLLSLFGLASNGACTTSGTRDTSDPSSSPALP